MRPLVVAVALALALLGPERASAQRRCASPWAGAVVEEGSLARGARCDRAILATGAHAARHSYARVWLPGATTPFRLRARLRRLTADGHRSIEVELLGGTLLLRDGAWGVFLSDAQFARDGWREHPGLDTHREHLVEIVRRVDEAEIWLDGERLGTWPVVAEAAGNPALAVQGAPGARARVLVRDLSIEPLAAAGDQSQ